MPLPEARDLDELNTYLERCCLEDQRRMISGRSQRVGAALIEEQAHLLPLAAEPFDLVDTSFPTVDGLSCVRVRTNRYSVPLPPGTKVEARVSADHVEVWHEGPCSASTIHSGGRQLFLPVYDNYWFNC